MLFFVTTLVLSLLGMVGLLTVKRYELTSGKLIFAGVRPGASTFFERTLRWGEKILPHLVKQQAERASRYVVRTLQLALAHSIVWLERTLEQVLSAMRERTENVDLHNEPSAFLREVADHKKNLLKKTRARDTVQESKSL